jgi:cation:H+ antiporter
MSFLLPLLAVAIGLVVLIWSSDQFVDGAAGTARYFRISPLIIGMVIVGFGTSAPELVVSVTSALKGKPALAIGNAYGSNIANIALILGVASLVKPISVRSTMLRRELPLLGLITLVVAVFIQDLSFNRTEGFIQLGLFAMVMSFTVWLSQRDPEDAFLVEMESSLLEQPVRLGRALLQLMIGLVLLIASSRILVWGAVEIATLAGVSELVIGLTVVAIGTSLPELASTIAAVRKGQDEMALGNVVGSNMFNTLAVVGLASSIKPVSFESDLLLRDFPVMVLLTISLFVVGFGFKGNGRINRLEGGLLLLSFIGYTGWLVVSTVGSRVIP